MDNLFSKIVSLNNLFDSWSEFRKSKRRKFDVQKFEFCLEDNLFDLHMKLRNQTYRHSSYSSFYITDPKVRHIHKACVKDRLVHHAIYRILYSLFDKGFIPESYSCRVKKGTHKAVNQLEYLIKSVSQNQTKDCWALKCDIKKFFASVGHEILFNLVRRKIADEDVLSLIWEIISSFGQRGSRRSSNRESISTALDTRERERERESKKFRVAKTGLPIGNLTSQLFANIYLNELDQLIKHKLKIKHYLRYCDDFVILDNDPTNLLKIQDQIELFLNKRLKLGLHPNKVVICKLNQGIDFLGYVALPHYRTLRTKTKKRMLKRINDKNSSSYFGLLKHCNGYKLKNSLKNMD